MFKIKQKYLDHFTGFSLALLAAFPVVRENLIPLPGQAMVIPLFFLYVSGIIRLYIEGKKLFKWKVIIYTYSIYLMFLFLFLSVTWSYYPVEINSDLQNIFFILVMLPAILFSFNIRVLDYFFSWIVLYGIYVTCIYINDYIQAANLRGWAVGQSQYLVRSFLIGMGALISLSKLLFYPNINKKFYGFISLFLYFGLAIALGRAALLGAVLIGFVLIFFYFRNNWPKSYSYLEYFKNKSSLILVMMFFGFVAFAVTQIERTFSRLMRLFTGAEFSTGRVKLWNDAFFGFFDSPLIGHGLSNSGAVINFNYPHNLYLQIMVDGGLIALVLLLIISLYPLLLTFRAYQKKLLKSVVFIPLLSCYIFYLINFMLAMNFYEGRILIALGLIIVLMVHNVTSKAGR